MHTLTQFKHLYPIILSLLSILLPELVTCNQTVDQWQKAQQQLNQTYLQGSSSFAEHGPKLEIKPGLASKKIRFIDKQSLASNATIELSNDFKPEANQTWTEKIQPIESMTTEILPVHITPNIWPYSVPRSPKDYPDDDSITVVATDITNSTEAITPTQDKRPTVSTPTAYVTITNPAMPNLSNNDQYTKQSLNTSKKPIEFVTVPDIPNQRFKSKTSSTPTPPKNFAPINQPPNKSSSTSVSSPAQQQPTPSPLLLYSIRFEIRSFDLMASIANKQYNDHSESNSALVDQHRLKNPQSKTLIAGLKNAICLDFFYSPPESFIFWIDVIEEKIFRGSISNGVITNVNMVVQGGLSSAEGLAVDWVAKNIYWVESTFDHIEVANMNGSSRRTLIAGDMESPRAISVDPRYGLLFWTDWDKKSPRIERATMSGDDRKTIVDIKEVNGGWPNGLTLDYEALKVYWIDANSDSIHVVDYEGNEPKALLRKIKSRGHPFAITLFDNNLYWTDWKTNFISMANKIDGSEPKAQIQRHQTRLFDIKVFHSSRQPKVEDSLNPCAINNGNCSHLCLLSVSHSRVCECPHLMRLASDNATCVAHENVLLIGRSNEIRAVDIARPRYYFMPPITVPRVFGPRQFEFDAKSRSIFWADSSTNEVKRALLAGSNIETVIDVIIETPNGLSLDWISGNLYVTSASSSTKTGKIFISNLKGEFISILMDYQKGIVAPKSIAVHPMLGLMFCIDENRQGEPLIFMASMSGHNKSIITERHIDQTLTNPVSLAIDFETDRVYWVNQASTINDNATIQYYDIAKDRIITLYNDAELPAEQRFHPGVLCVDGDYLIISSRAPSYNLIRVNKNNITDRFVYKTQTLDHIMALKVYNSSSQMGTNACKLNNGGCSQLCIPTSPAHRVCKCTMGYSINPKNKTECVGKNLFLVYSSNQGMKGISLSPNSSTEEFHLPPIYRAFRASSIDYVYNDDLIYWVDNEEGSITRINRDTTNHQIVVQGLEAEQYIGIDWVAENIYWLDPYYDVIEVARLNGSNRYVIISGDIDKANGLVVNPLKGYIVWSDIGSLPKIERARLDGSDRKVLVSTKVSHIDELAVDFLDDYIYWIDSTTSIIERVKSDGSARKVVYDGQSTGKGSQEHFIAMAIYQQYLYIADASYDGSIIRLDKDNATDSTVIQHNLGDNIKDITIFAPQPRPRLDDNPCVLNNGGCQNLCLYLGEPGKKRCICSHGKLKPDNLTCEPHDKFLMYSKLSQIDSLHIEEEESHDNAPFPPITIESKSHIISLTIDYKEKRVIYSEMTQDQICSVLFNGTDRKVLVEKQSMVEGIAFENNQLYWTSIKDNSISKLSISSSGLLEKNCTDTKCQAASIEKLVMLGSDDKPRGIALDSCSSYIYWTNWNNEASIQRASPATGYKVESIIKTDIKVPNGIAIDKKRRKLYWCDARLDKIETCDMDGSNRIILKDARPQHPFALAVWKNSIFWTDWLARGVFRADKYTGQNAMQIKKIAQRPMGIAVAASYDQTCPKDYCARNNGGCPATHVCVTRMTDMGEQQISCRATGQQLTHHLKTVAPRGNWTCLGAENVTKCREYHAILADELEPYRSQESTAADIEDDKTSVPLLESQDLPGTTTISPRKSSTNNIQTSTVKNRAGPVIPQVLSPRPSFTPDKRSSQPSSSGSQNVTTIQPTLTTDTTSLSQSTTSSPALKTNSTLQPCQVVSAPVQTTTADSSIMNCQSSSEFRCYLSEKLICIENVKRCDGSYDCPSREDESDCFLASKGQYTFKHDSNWPKFVTVILIILAAAVAAQFMVFGNRGRRRWFVGSYNGFSHSKMFEDNGTNIEISNPMFDEDDSVNLVNCPFSIDLNERTTNFSNPLYERQVLLVNDKNPAA